VEVSGLFGVFCCAAGAGLAGAVVVGCAVSGVGFAVSPELVVGAIAGAAFEEGVGDPGFAGVAAPDGADGTPAGAGALAEGWDAAVFEAEFAVVAELELEAGTVGTELGGTADPVGVFAEFAGVDAFAFAAGEGVASVFTGTCAAGFGAGFRKASP
jgi:hypothetical protein